MKKLIPIVKWAGGKRWLTKRHSVIFPDSYSRLIEPFVGGASVFLALQPKNAILADVNDELIITYRVIRDNWEVVLKGLEYHGRMHSKEHYYATRDATPTNPTDIAIRFLYLNRTCWNGLYRVNKKGKFNVPIGTKTSVLLDTDDFEQLSEALQGDISILNQDYSKTMDQVERDDFVYIDPPYTVNHNKNGFLKYNEKIFSWKDQLLLRDKVDDAARLGAKIIISQASHESITELYQSIGLIQKVTRSSILAGDSRYRKKVEELIIQINC